MVTIRNANFICSQMTARDIKSAFDFKGGVNDFIYKTLIEHGYIRKHSRYYAPTDKLMELAFVPNILTLNEYQRRWFSLTEHFYEKDAVEMLDGNSQIFKKMLKIGLLKQISGGRFRRSENFAEALSEGESTFKLKTKEEENG